MKKAYEAPALEVEIFELNANIAGSCNTVVNSGPAIDGYRDTVCEGYDDGEGGITWSARSAPLPTDFYDTSVCDCKYSSTGQGYFTS